ncbi:unnamed protein product [Paramecium octaurelia]|uniref:Uncharacterized protein n=1 Tax=Paramecium octaurelia TaxID=43137 RepID=A0A8S1VIK8_PAROT|nr:unnamed protein product [Paramecium octaurelia]
MYNSKRSVKILLVYNNFYQILQNVSRPLLKITHRKPIKNFQIMLPVWIIVKSAARVGFKIMISIILYEKSLYGPSRSIKQTYHSQPVIFFESKHAHKQEQRADIWTFTNLQNDDYY